MKARNLLKINVMLPLLPYEESVQSTKFRFVHFSFLLDLCRYIDVKHQRNWQEN